MKFGLPEGANPDEIPEEERLAEVGMPIGNLTSQLFANLYLNELDQFAKHKLRLRYYIRYMDDIIIIHHDKKYLAATKEAIEEFLNNELRLQLNRKTTIRPCSMGVDFVGFRIWATHRRLKKKTVRKIKRRLKYLFEGYARGKIDKETLERSIASYKGILMHCNSYGLRQELNRLYKQSGVKLKDV
jgi:hypothetical protein